MNIKEASTEILKPKEENKSSLMVPNVSAGIIKSLPKNFVGRGEVRGYEFSLVSKTKWGFCYEVDLNGIITHYEVCLRKINKRTSKTKEKAIPKLNSLKY
jgi:hypothetical protein